MTTQITAKIDTDYKAAFDNLCKDIGVTVSSAINIFVKRMVLNNGFPFDINENANIPNELTLSAILESEKDIAEGTSKEFSTLEEMRNYYVNEK
jgi:DNA-damage-inducible protein J